MNNSEVIPATKVDESLLVFLHDYIEKAKPVVNFVRLVQAAYVRHSRWRAQVYLVLVNP